MDRVSASCREQERMNVLYIGASSEIGGAENSLRVLLKGLNKELFQPTVVLPLDGPFAKSVTDLDIELLITPLSPLKSRNPVPYLMTVRRLAKLMKTKRIDLVHCNQDVCNQYAVPAARLNRIPIVCHTRTIIPEKRAFQRTFLGFSDVLIAISRNVAASYTPYTRKPQRVMVIPNGVDLMEFSPSPLRRDHSRRELHVAHGTYLMGLLGRIIPQKGHHVMVQALARLAKTHPNTCLVVAGGAKTGNHTWFQDGAFLNDLRRLINDLGVTQKVIFTGFVDHVRAIYESLDVLVVPSLVEACGRTALEAMAMQIPVVASDVGPAREVVEDDRTALLVPPNDPEQLAMAIETLMTNRVLARELGENGRRRVEKYFSSEQHVRTVEQLYRSVRRGAPCRA